MTAINGNVTNGPPDHPKYAAWDRPEITEDAVTVWRGTADEPQRDVIFLLRGSYPDEIAGYFEALAYAIRNKAAGIETQQEKDNT